MEVTVIMLVYNHERYLRKALESILKQKVNFEYEILISDDVSTDKSRDILKEYQNKFSEKINILFRKENVGPTKNHYDLLKMARGKYIAQLEGDDFWIDDMKLQKQYDLLQATNFIGIAHSNVVVDSKDKITGEYKPYKKEKVLKMNDLIKKGMVYHTATIMYRNVFNLKKDYDVLWKAHKLVSDFTLAFILLDLGNILYFPENMSAYRINDSSADNASNLMKKNLAKSYIKILNSYDYISDWYCGKYNLENLKILRTEEVLRNYYLNKNFSKKDLKNFLNQIKIKSKCIAYIKTFERGIFYIIKNKVRIGWKI